MIIAGSVLTFKLQLVYKVSIATELIFCQSFTKSDTYALLAIRILFIVIFLVKCIGTFKCCIIPSLSVLNDIAKGETNK